MQEKKKYGADLMQSPALREAKQLGLKTRINPLLLAIPAACDLCASTLMFIALTMVAASVYQMMRGLIIVITAFMSIIFLGRRYHRHHWTGITAIIFGILLVGLATVISGSKTETNPVGLIFLLGSQIAAGTMFIVEEKLLGKYYLNPLKVVGWEGIWGVSFYVVLLFIFQFIKCKPTEEMCQYGRFEDSISAFQEMVSNPWILVLSIGTCFTIASFNAFGIAVTKYASAANRAVLDSSRTVLIWIFFLVVPVQDWREKFLVLQLVGFIFLIFGTLLFNEIIELPILGFDQNTRRAKEKRDKGTRLIDEDDEDRTVDAVNVSDNDAENFMPSSPAHYDYQKNYRHVKEQMEDAAKPTKD